MMYEYQCPIHGSFDIVCNVAEHINPYPCPRVDTAAGISHAIPCRKPSDQAFSANVFLQPDICESTYIEGINQVVSSKQGLEEAMKRTGTRRWEAGMDKDIERNKQYKEEANDRERQKVIAKVMEDY